jgi:hypothetical protein
MVLHRPVEFTGHVGQMPLPRVSEFICTICRLLVHVDYFRVGDNPTEAMKMR